MLQKKNERNVLTLTCFFYDFSVKTLMCSYLTLSNHLFVWTLQHVNFYLIQSLIFGEKLTVCANNGRLTQNIRIFTLDICICDDSEKAHFSFFSLLVIYKCSILQAYILSAMTAICNKLDCGICFLGFS